MQAVFYLHFFYQLQFHFSSANGGMKLRGDRPCAKGIGKCRQKKIELYFISKRY
jgi:hypothetical protein